MADVTKRMLDLLAVLRTGRRFSGAELAQRLDTSPRTLRRDVERLREYGYPVTTQPGPSGFYQLSPGTRLPPLIFDDDEAVATLIGLAMAAAATRTVEPSGPHSGDSRDARAGMGAAADRAYGKVDQLLPARLRPRMQLVRASMEVAPVLAPVIDAAVFGGIGEACTRHEQVGFRYHGPGRVITARRVEPYRQVLLHQRWYLLAWDLDKDDWRTFRIDRIHDLTPTGRRFTPRTLPAEDGREYLRAALSRGRHRAVVTVDAPADLVADRLKFADCAIQPLRGEQCRVTAFVDSFHWLVINIGLIEADFHIDEPAEFAELGRQMAQRLIQASSRDK